MMHATIPPLAELAAPNDRTRAQKWAESSLVQHPHWLELRGSPNELTWPRICASCGAAASEQIVVKKAFRPRPRRSHRGKAPSMRPYRITGVPVPFCGACAAEHRATVQPPSMAKKLTVFLVNPLIIPVVGSAWVTSKLLDGVRGMSFRESGGWLGWGLIALMGATCVWSVFLMWQTTRASRLDPRTAITRACDFSEDVSELFEPERRIYAMQNKTFAEAFAHLNAARAWTAQDQVRSQRMSMLVAVLMLVALGGAAALITLFKH
jgi:hypothetical protein